MKFIFLALCLAIPASAANFHCVYPGGTGDGHDWSNPMSVSAVASSAIRGDTYYLGGSTTPYQGITLTAAQSGLTYIFIKKATQSDHGTDVGWQTSYGTNTAVFWNVDIRSGYWSFDGGPHASMTNGFGIIAHSSATNEDNFTIGVFNGFSGPGVQLKNMEIYGMAGGGIDAPVSKVNVLGFASGSYDGLLLDHCYIHNGGATMVNGGNANNVTIQYCWLQTLGSGDPAKHCTHLALSGQVNANIRYNVFADCLFDCTTYIEPQVACNGFWVYGNIFRAISANEYSSQGALAITGNDGPQMLDVRFYNNDLFSLHILTGGGVWGGSVAGANTVLMTNNIMCSPSDANFPNVVRDYNWYPSGPAVEPHGVIGAGVNPFLNAGAGDFHIAGAVGPGYPRNAGTALSSTFNTDPDGTIRGLVDGTWDIGAYEYVPPPPPPVSTPPNQPNNIFPADSSAGISLTPTITGSAYSSSSGVQTKSEFKLYASDGTTLIKDWIDGAVITWTVPANLLTYSTSYKFTISYQNAYGWSTPSTQTTFTTAAAPTPPTPPPSPGTNTITIKLTNSPSFLINGKAVVK